MSRAYWTAYYEELLRLDARNCSIGTECGNSCIPQKKTCRKSSSSPQQKKRTRRIAQLAGGAAAPAVPAGKASSRVAEMSPDDIAVDPKRFQYKLSSNAQGEVGSLSGVRQWDDDLAGVISVWKDPADGKVYVVNGHNRVALAKRLGAENVTVRFLNASSAKEARAIGALQNIAGGQGTSIDAAKFFRDSGITDQAQIEARGLPLKSGKAAEGLALAALPEHVFNAVVQGDLTPARGAIIGGSGLDETKQAELYKLTKSRKILTDGTLRELVDAARQSQQSQVFEMDLFGGSMEVKDNLILRAKVTDKLKRKLASEKRLFATVAKSKAAAELEAKAGNRINTEESGKVAQEATRVLAVFDQFKNQSGPVSAAINRAVARIEAGEREAAVMKELQAEMTKAMTEMLGAADRGRKDSRETAKLATPKRRTPYVDDGIDWAKVVREAETMIDLNPQDKPEQ